MAVMTAAVLIFVPMPDWLWWVLAVYFAFCIFEAADDFHRAMRAMKDADDGRDKGLSP